MKCCKHCGAEITDDSVYCELCGAKVHIVSPDVNRKNRNPNTKKHIVYVVAAIMAGILICVVTAIIVTNNTDSRLVSNKISESFVDTVAAPVEKYDSEQEQPKAQEWVDLGLPSGTHWKDSNEEGFYTYKDAVGRFEGVLPTKKQMKELVKECNWHWRGNGYNVEGPNGNVIFLPAAGYREGRTVDQENIGSFGSYWSSTPGPGDGAYALVFGHGGVGGVTDTWDRTSDYWGFSVRLVKTTDKHLVKTPDKHLVKTTDK